MSVYKVTVERRAVFVRTVTVCAETSQDAANAAREFSVSLHDFWESADIAYNRPTVLSVDGV